MIMLLYVEIDSPEEYSRCFLSLSVFDGKRIAKGRILSRMETSVRRSYVRFRSPKRWRSRCRRCPIHQSESSRIGHVDQGAARLAGTCGEDQIAEQDYFTRQRDNESATDSNQRNTFVE